ncbi:MAG: hypothetical protein Q8916_11485 [Bacteroidota bacterium]|nr:hypothetical protein [Bacteroidota bacterium]MDP4231011.1 hypothetical protein [Bacteroidota bacterium]
MMKITIFSAALLCLGILSQEAAGQIPRSISYQGVLAHSDGSLVADGNHSLTLSLYLSATGSTSIYSEVQNVAVVRGIFNIIIGSVTPIPPSIGFDRAYFLGVAVDGGAELTPRTPLTSAPYALNAQHASVADALTSPAGGGSLIPGTLHGSVVLEDTMSQVLSDLSGARIEIEGTNFWTLSDALGNWEIRNLPMGTYTIRCSKEGFGFSRMKGFQFVGGGDFYMSSAFFLGATPGTLLRWDYMKADSQRVNFIVNNFNGEPYWLYFIFAIGEKQDIDPRDSSNWCLLFPNYNTTPGPGTSQVRYFTIYDLQNLGYKLQHGKTYYARVFALGRSVQSVPKVSGYVSTYYEPVSGKTIYTSFGPPSDVVSFVMP